MTGESPFSGPRAFPPACGTAFNPSGKDRLMVWLGNPFFCNAMRHFRWRVVYGPCAPSEVYTWERILTLTGGEPPEAVVAGDLSWPPFILGVENFPCLTVFYSVDAHIHAWHPAYAQGFDLCLVSLKERTGDFCTGRLSSGRIIWSPPYARDDARPPVPLPEKEWDLLFVGTMSPELAPARCAFLEQVRERFPGLRAMSGDFAALYPKARLALNECTRGELNFRVFEALGCGVCLLTPDIGPAVTELFTDGKELVLYPDHDAEALADRARFLLADDARREAIAAAGLAAVDAGHRAGHRALALASRLHALLASGEGAALITERQQQAPAIFTSVLRPLYLHHAESIAYEPLRLIYLKAARGEI